MIQKPWESKKENQNKESQTTPSQTDEAKAPRNEAQGVKNFSKEMLSALGTALLFIIYVIQAFTIPTGSMERSLMVGDFLLGLKFVYGAPILPATSSLPLLNKLPIPDTYWKFPALKNPARGDVLIFKYPGFDRKDYIKRCVAVAGDTVEVIGTDLFVNGIRQTLPPKGQFVSDSTEIKKSGTPIADSLRPHFAPLYIPKKGDTLHLNNLAPREFHFYKNLIRQEHPYKDITEKYRLLVDGIDESRNDHRLFYDQRQQQWQVFPFYNFSFDKMDTLNYWTQYDFVFKSVIESPDFTDKKVVIEKRLFMDGEALSEYVVKQDNYFMMGDNRDNSADSRFWGFLNRNYVKAQALIVYFSFENKDRTFGLLKPTTWWRIPGKIRFNRFGKQIRAWDGMPEDIEANRKEVLFAPDPVGDLLDSVMQRPDSLLDSVQSVTDYSLTSDSTGLLDSL